MKVFGTGGGAYDSDYMAAIEDAIILEADAINLSLGSAMAGNHRHSNAAYQTILDNVVNSDTVLVISAGNAGGWADQTYGGYLYDDGVNLDTLGSPGLTPTPGHSLCGQCRVYWHVFSGWSTDV